MQIQPPLSPYNKMQIQPPLSPYNKMQIQPPLSPYNKPPHTFPSIFFDFIEYLLSTQYTTKKSDQEMRGWVDNKSKVGGISPKKMVNSSSLPIIFWRYLIWTKYNNVSIRHHLNRRSVRQKYGLTAFSGKNTFKVSNINNLLKVNKRTGSDRGSAVFVVSDQVKFEIHWRKEVYVSISTCQSYIPVHPVPNCKSLWGQAGGYL